MWRARLGSASVHSILQLSVEVVIMVRGSEPERTEFSFCRAWSRTAWSHSSAGEDDMLFEGDRLAMSRAAGYGGAIGSVVCESLSEIEPAWPSRDD